MAIKKENASLTAKSESLKDKKPEDLIQVRKNLKKKPEEKNYEAGVDPQDEQLNPVPEGESDQRGDSKPGGGNRLQ